MKYLLSLFLAATVLNVFPQSYTVSGYIEDASSKERLIGVNVYLGGTNYGTTTNTYGFYSITVPAGKYALIASYIGYNSHRDSIDLTQGNVKHDFAISQSSSELTEVEVTAEELPAQQARMSTIRMNVPDIKKIPAFLGEVDIIRAIQLLPGVQSGSEGTTGFYVRGGSPDQNLILLDGVPVYNASHLFGFFSVFNADAIKNVQLTKGGFPARFGGRLSSVLEIDMKEGDMKEFHGEGSIGIISSKLTLEGPLIKDKTSFIISGRRMYYDLIIQPFLPEDIKLGYYFGDLNIKLNHVLSRKNRFYLSYYGGIDNFSYRDDYRDRYVSGGVIKDYQTQLGYGLKWGNRTGSFRWNHLFNDQIFGNLTATYTRYRFSVGYENIRTDNTAEPPSSESQGYEYFSLIEDLGLRYDLEYVVNSSHSLRFGANYTHHDFLPGVAQLENNFAQVKVDSILQFSRPINSNDLYFYAEDDWLISNKWRANYGLHYSAYFVDNTFYHSLQPRISARYLFRDNWSFKASYARMTQYVHLLSNSGIGLPTDLWVSSTADVKPQEAHQVAIGSTRNLGEDMYEISAEAYYKYMENLIEYKEGASFVSPTDWQNTVETDGQGWAYGFELLLRKNEGKTTGWIGYTLAWTNRQFSNLNNGESFPYKYDRRHDISIVANHKFSDRFDLGATWVYGSGNTFTAPISNFYLNNGLGQLGLPVRYQKFTDRNALRLPAYHRFDLGFNFHRKTRWGKSTWNLSIYNVYSRNNPFFLYIDTDYQTEQRTVKQVSLFPIIPAVAYIFKF